MGRLSWRDRSRFASVNDKRKFWWITTAEVHLKTFATHSAMDACLYMTCYARGKFKKKLKLIGGKSGMREIFSSKRKLYGITKENFAVKLPRHLFHYLFNWHVDPLMPAEINVVFYDLIPFLMASRQMQYQNRYQYIAYKEDSFIPTLNKAFGLARMNLILAPVNEFMTAQQHLEGEYEAWRFTHKINVLATEGEMRVMPNAMTTRDAKRQILEQQERINQWNNTKLKIKE